MKTVILTLLMFGIIINLHELGHFIFAKLFDVRINEFSFGMGPKLFSKQKNETMYSIRLLPIGGYVAMDGEDGETDETKKLDGRAFCDKKPWQKFLILSAGAGMNIILGFFIILGLTFNMDVLGTNQILKIEENSSISGYLKPQDKILTVNGNRTSSYNDVVFQLLRDEDGVIDVTVLRDNKKMNISSVPFTLESHESGRQIVKLDMIFLGVENSFFKTFDYAFNWTISIIKQVWFSLFDIITGRYGLKEISGPVGTAEIVSQASKIGWSSLFSLLAFITLNVGVFNLLPIPALDGGRLFFLLIEIIFRKPVPQKYEAYVHATGMVLLLGLIAVITVKDIIYLFK